MAAVRALLALVIVLLGVWLSFFGRNWQQGPTLPSLAAAATNLPAEPLPSPNPVGPALGEIPTTAVAAVMPEPPPEIATPTFTATHAVRAIALHLRERPSSASPSLGSYPRGTLLMALGRQANWIEVRLADGTEGWMSSRYLGTAPTVETAAASR
jgi:hypothetical protein